MGVVVGVRLPKGTTLCCVNELFFFFFFFFFLVNIFIQDDMIHVHNTVE